MDSIATPPYTFNITDEADGFVYYQIKGPPAYPDMSGARRGDVEEVTAHIKKTIERLNFRMGYRAYSASWRGVQRHLKKKPKTIGFTKKSIKQQKAKARGKE